MADTSETRSGRLTSVITSRAPCVLASKSRNQIRAVIVRDHDHAIHIANALFLQDFEVGGIAIEHERLGNRVANSRHRCILRSRILMSYLAVSRLSSCATWKPTCPPADDEQIPHAVRRQAEQVQIRLYVLIFTNDQQVIARFNDRLAPRNQCLFAALNRGHQTG